MKQCSKYFISWGFFLCILPVTKISSSNTQKVSVLWAACIKPHRRQMGNRREDRVLEPNNLYVLLGIPHVEGVMFNIRFTYSGLAE